METITLSLPPTLLEFIDQQVAERGEGNRSSFVEQLVRREQEQVFIEMLRKKLLEAADAPSIGPLDASYFDGLRQWVIESARGECKS